MKSGGILVMIRTSVVIAVGMVRLTLSFKGPLSGLILNFRFYHFPFSTVSRAEGGGGLFARAAGRAVKRHEELP